MKVLYIAKHGSGDNDDEGAITYALRKLNHTVHCVKEPYAEAALQIRDADLLLFHKLERFDVIQQCDAKAKVFWYFDLVEYPDETLKERNSVRSEWIRRATELVHVGFCTDGDCVLRDTTGKLVRLTQGMDERFYGYGHRIFGQNPPLLFAGSRSVRCGVERSSHVAELLEKYGSRMRVVEGRRRVQ